jgi:hypothetical protein
MKKLLLLLCLSLLVSFNVIANDNVAVTPNTGINIVDNKYIFIDGTMFIDCNKYLNVGDITYYKCSCPNTGIRFIMATQTSLVLFLSNNDIFEFKISPKKINSNNTCNYWCYEIPN